MDDFVDGNGYILDLRLLLQFSLNFDILFSKIQPMKLVFEKSWI